MFLNIFLLLLLILFKEILYIFLLILLFSRDALNGPKVALNTFIMLQKISVSNKCCSFYSSVTPEK